MMNLKETINFKTLRDKGPSAIEVKGDEVVQVVSKGSDIKVIISQEYFLNLLAAYNNSQIRAGVKEEKTVNIEDRLRSFEEKLSKVMAIAEEKEDDKKWQAGRKKVGSY